MQSSLRIIGGKWRSRKISFLPLRGVRPTTNVTRETLFNWLSPVIVGATCLDLFAGSGALGFEALSRGAEKVVMADASIKVLRKLKENAEVLGTENVEFYLAQIPERLGKIPKQIFNIIFLDPPFNCNLVKPACEKLLTSGYLAGGSLVYIETEKKLNIESQIPNTWQILRHKTTGLVKSSLVQV
jgi:16S rRNA (guanine966-N2)-methyltransferase